MFKAMTKLRGNLIHLLEGSLRNCAFLRTACNEKSKIVLAVVKRKKREHDLNLLIESNIRRRQVANA